MILYKYCDEKGGLDLLKNSRIKITNLADINDPFEFLPQRDYEIEEFDKLVKHLYEYQKENYRILSLSKSACNIVMWGHYCNKHKGILFKINTDKISDINGNRLEDALKEVTYAKERPKINLQSNDIKEMGKSLELITYTKFEDWKYEEEVRAIIGYDHKENYDYLDIPADSILEVVLGINSAWETDTLVKVLLEEKRLEHVKLKKAEIDKKRYFLNYNDL